MENLTRASSALPSFRPDPARPMRLLQHCPIYKATPLHTVPCGAGPVLVKDERERMGLGAFKGLGGVYAVAQLISHHWRKVHGHPLSPSALMTPAVRDFAEKITFVCASAGNHGLAVAAGAQLFGAKARIHLSEGVPGNYVSRLKEKGADVVVSGVCYEDSVVAAIEDAEQTNSVLLADSSWPGYSKAPSLVMEGYTVIAEELRASFAEQNKWPTHVFLQAGVGGLAAALTYMIRFNWAVQPEIIIVEPEAAPCLWKSSLSGYPVAVKGPASNMGRLDCKEPSHIAFSVLETSDVKYVQVSDQDAAAVATVLTAKGFPTTPSGAAGFAGLQCWSREKKQNSSFHPLIIISETII